MIPEFGKLVGSVIRSKWRKIKRLNLDYQFNGKVHNINDIIHFVEYSSSNLDNLVINNQIIYAKPLNLEIYIPKKYGHWQSYFEDIPQHIFLHGGVCGEQSSPSPMQHSPYFC
jgi:hypothetical protein